MFDLDAIETINFEQLATATDRLLLHRGQVPRHRLDSKPFDPERTVLVRRRRRRGFVATGLLVSSVVTGVLSAFAAIAVLV
jgi:hypothetical protein